jgi:hypothetical protein
MTIEYRFTPGVEIRASGMELSCYIARFNVQSFTIRDADGTIVALSPAESMIPPFSFSMWLIRLPPRRPVKCTAVNGRTTGCRDPVKRQASPRCHCRWTKPAS